MSASASKDLQEAATHSTSDATQPPIAAGENLACQWEKCTERCVSAVALFDHICDKHIGRKSTNNLNLTCGWASCRTTTVKRDHITSHVRVHVPLKPHKCDFCKKAFKRPQDLKKHVKTHADDSVLRSPNMNGRMNSPGANKSVHMMNALQYRGGAPSSAYYGQGVPMAGAHGPYGSVHPSQNGYYSQQQPPYGPVYYPSSHGGDAGHHSYDSRKRGYETLNEFFGDAKRRQIDPTSYTQVGQRLMSLQGIPLQQGEMAEYMSTEPSLVPVGGQHGGNHGHLPSHQYALPLPNLRTKTDLLNIDQFLEQMQSTVYESSNAAAAAGVHQPGAHYTHAGVNFRQSHSPPQTNVHHLGNVNSSMPSSHSAPIMSNHSSSQSNSSNAPTLTPSSSKMSYTSGNSPVSSQGMSPVIKSNRTTSSAYPTLPTASLSYPSHPTAAPTSTLGPTFNNDPRRRYSGGMLQKSSNPPADSDDLNCINGSTDLTPHENSKAASQAADNIDPALAEVSSPMDLSDGSESARDRAEESWIENIRVIEALRSMVSDRLRRKEYEAEDEDVSMTDVEQKTIKTEPKDSESLYPNLRSKFESTE